MPESHTQSAKNAVLSHLVIAQFVLLPSDFLLTIMGGILVYLPAMTAKPQHPVQYDLQGPDISSKVSFFCRKAEERQIG